MQNSIKRGRPSKQKLVVEFDSKSVKLFRGSAYWY